MRNDRIFKMTRGLSVVASSSLLLLSAVGAASAHPGTANSRVLADGDALRARIMSMEPDLDDNEVDELVEAVQEAMDGDVDGADAEDAADEDHDQAEPLGDRSGDVRQAEDGDHGDGAHHDSDADENDDDQGDDENEDGDHENGDHENGDHENGDHENGDHENGDD